MSAAAIAIVAVGITQLAVLAPLIVAQGRRQDRFESRTQAGFEALSTVIAEMRSEQRADMAELGRYAPTSPKCARRSLKCAAICTA